MPPLGYFDRIIGEIAKDFVDVLFSNMSTSENTSKNDEIEDLGYAVVVDEDGNEIKNY
jgi:hypothetical protein